MGRAPCCDKANVKKGPWSPEEDLKLKEYIEKYGTGGNWISLPQKAGLRRCGKSCRLRWLNYLRPNIKHGEFSDDEDRIICTLFANIGSRWSIIAAQLPGRTDNDIKNYWNTKLKKKFMGMVAQSPSQRKLNHQSTLSSLFQPSPSLSSPSYKCSSHIYNYTPSSLEAPINMSSVPLRLLNSNTSMTLQHQESFGGVMQYHYPTKDSSSSLLMFGGGDQASCSSSDGSCNNQLNHGSGGDDLQMGLGSYFYNGVEEDQKFMLSNGGGDVNGWSHDQKPNGMWGERSGGAPFDYGLEEIKQLISTNFLVDENMTEERVMYY